MRGSERGAASPDRAEPLASVAASLVSVKGLTRRFGQREALAGVDLEVAPREIVALVGPNGCGKTTLMRILAGFLRPSEGTARVFDLEPFRHRAEIMRRARFAFAPPALYESLSAREHLVGLGKLGIGRPLRRSEVNEALEIVGLEHRADDRVRTYSFGMRQRLALALSLLPRPELLVLDEPNDGLDPLAVLELRDVLKRLCRELSLTLVLSSHLLLEVDQLVDRMLVLREGHGLFLGTPDELRGGVRAVRVEVADPEPALSVLERAGLDPHRNGDGSIILADASAELSRVQQLLAAEGIELTGFHRTRATLEEALLETLRRASQEQGPGR